MRLANLSEDMERTGSLYAVARVGAPALPSAARRSRRRDTVASVCPAWQEPRPCQQRDCHSPRPRSASGAQPDVKFAS